MANIIGTKSNDTLFGSNTDTLTGAGGNDIYESHYGTYITDFGGVGKGVNPSAAVIAEVDTLDLQYLQTPGLTARNMLLTQNGSNLEITFEGLVYLGKFVLQNFALENLENLSKSTGATVDLGNIKFYGQTTITDSFDVFNANSTQSTIFNRNTVTFLNDLNNNVNGFDNSDDVINGQGGDDIIDGKSGNDLLRGGAGNNTLIGGVGNDTLNVEFSTGDNLLLGGTGNDVLDAGATSGNNLLSGGDGNDSLSASYLTTDAGYNYIPSSSNNTLDGGAGDDYLTAQSPSDNNSLSGGDGNDSLSTSGLYFHRAYFSFISSGNNTLDGGAGDDTLSAEYSSGNNLLFGGDGNDSLSTSGHPDGLNFYPSLGNNTLKGGAGDDTLSADYSSGNNFLSGDDGNDSFSLSTTNTLSIDLVTQTVDGGTGDDLLSLYTGIEGSVSTISTFNPTTNTGSITTGTYRVSYKNIERLYIPGTDSDDNIVGGSGNDTLSTGNGGKDTIDGATGNDLLSVNYYNTSGGITTTFNATNNIGSITAGTYRVNYKNIEQLDITGTAYNDNIVGNSGNDTLSTGDGGNDTIDGGTGDDLLGVDYASATKGITSTINASTTSGAITAGSNSVSYKNIERLEIYGTSYDDYILGGNGNDSLFGGGSGNDTLNGGNGNDSLFGGRSGNNRINGGNGDDFLSVDYSNDTIDGGNGDDILSVDYGNPTKGITSTINPTINSGSITAGTNSVSYKNIERLKIYGTSYDDNIVGSNGNDTLSGSSGNDTLTGGKGSDTFVFDLLLGEEVGNLYDFNPTNDLIQVSARSYSDALSLGSLQTSQFTIGTSATTNEEQFIYNSATGALFFDLDGSASGFTQVKFAQLSPGLSLTNNNFVVV
ncbi:calcium-binding protein (plasmid) [Nostoc sp. UHCC 0926]|uniref:beta strand repeat-containing protein n=1 Tax=Nostoc sp. UHCC 0926 TaxID=3025190 RepID=UPI00236012A1|nr:calcium-binding protein [Nostoc sp. UHCC 0926]WDD36477.1 calcium-binding protein [Nostoc sp. UHCC 0926]